MSNVFLKPATMLGREAIAAATIPHVSMIRAIHRRAPKPVQREFARHLEQEVPDEEDAGGETEHGLGESEFLAHGQLRQSDIGSIKVVDELREAEERNEPSSDLPDHCRLDLGFLQYE
ncbi:hypothetical protein H5400_17340 [Rhodococcus wratislaviensis]|nr:hypothetical protein [Rhodococcus sp. 3A]MBC2894625.1 hypothetical protein [Rhodococcus sp. 4CII]